MRRIFISFLGVGSDGDGYDSLKYTFNKNSIDCQTQFVQRAEIELIGSEKFDSVIILCTNESFRNFFPELKQELVDIGVDEKIIRCEKINTGLSSESQWATFSLVNRLIANEDRIVFDFTHGFRLLSIILSASRYRKRFGEIFVSLCQYPEDTWKYRDDKKKQVVPAHEMSDFETILPFYETLKKKNIAEVLQGFVKQLVEYRNGFDHGWTSRSGIFDDVAEKADYFLDQINHVIEQIQSKQLL